MRTNLRRSVMQTLWLPLCISSFTCSQGMASDVLRDPTEPLGYRLAKKQGIALQLQAVFRKNATKKAVINGAFVEEGGFIHGWRLAKVNKLDVVLSKNGVTKTLVLRKRLTDQ